MTTLGVAYYSANPFEITSSGAPAARYQLWSFETDGVTPLQTWNDPLLTTPNANPIIADANGRFGSVWLTPSTAYEFQLFTAATPLNPTGSLVWTRGPFGPAAGGTISNTAGIIGEVRMFAGIEAAIPAGWYLCAGQAVSRTTYADLFAAIGTTYGAGDGSTFNLPDSKGRVGAGKDNMGGTPANRLTTGVSGVSGATLGASGGDQAVQIHTHTLNDPGHNHTDPGHDHGTVSPANSPSAVNGTNNKLVTATGGATATATTGIEAASTGVTIDNYGAGSSQNVQPTIIFNFIIYAGA